MDGTAVDTATAAPTRYITADDWAMHRDQMTRLYRNENKTLSQTMDTIEREHGLKATVKMYKSKITEWGLDKKNKKDEVFAMLRKKAERDAAGKKTVFKLRGRDVDFKDVQRYAARNHISETTIEELVASHPQTPPDLQCLTPEPMPGSLTSRDVCYTLEQILRNFGRYMVGSFEQKAWGSHPSGLGITYPIEIPGHYEKLQRSIDHFSHATCCAQRLLAGGRTQEAVPFLSSACSVVGILVRLGSIFGFSEIVSCISLLNDQRALSVISRCFADMASHLLSIADPRRQLYGALAQVRADQLTALNTLLSQLVAEEAKVLIGEYNNFTIDVSTYTLLARGDIKAARDWVNYMLQKIEYNFGQLDMRSIHLLHHKALISLEMSEYAAAEHECRQVLQRLELRDKQQNGTAGFTAAFHNTLTILRNAQLAQGDRLGAVVTLRSELAMAESITANEAQIFQILTDLEDLLRVTENSHEADQIGVRRLELLRKQSEL